ncbi:MAG: NAD(P)H-dependent oxidoreductase [Salinivirgaceae bacterium]|nr:NAD(P)H-dependent oxidoreductase [Salinivirgaceae bacterium]
MKKILIQFAHPAFHKSRINKELLKDIELIDGVTLRNLYEEYPNFHIDVKYEQQLLVEHDILIWHHPFYWYSAPSLLKEWIDLVLEHNFAFGKNGTALKGKLVMSAITAGGSKQAYTKEGYNHCLIHDLLLPFRKTAELCKMKYLPPFVVHGTHLFDIEKTKKMADDYRKLLISLRDDVFELKQFGQCRYSNDLLETSKI